MVHQLILFFFLGGGGQRPLLLLLSPHFFLIILFGSTTLLTGMTGIFLRMQWPLTTTADSFFAEKFGEVDGGEVPCQPWTTRMPKYVQPDLNFVGQSTILKCVFACISPDVSFYNLNPPPKDAVWPLGKNLTSMGKLVP
jgi:hypothetical protein